MPPTHRYTYTNIYGVTPPEYRNINTIYGFIHPSTQSLKISDQLDLCDTLYMSQERMNVFGSSVRTYREVSLGSSPNASSATCRILLPFKLLQRRMTCVITGTIVRRSVCESDTTKP